MSVCVVGAGLSGLSSIKCMIDAGFEVKCFEKDLHIGGRWHRENTNSVPRSTITNLPSYYCCFSDFPMPENYPLYLSAERLSRYFELYADNFDIYKHIKLGCTVISIKPLWNTEEDNLFGESCRWSVTYQTEGETVCVEQFDFVVISSGFYSKPYIPDKIQNVLSNFKGKVIHSIEYKDWKDFENQTVVVCGLGNTGGDVASDISDHCIETYISTSKGAHVIGRFFQGGCIPADTAATRILQYVPAFITKKITPIVIERLSNSVYSMDDLHLTPKSKGISTIVNDEICLRIASGKVKVKPSIQKINNKTVYFSNGTLVENVDTIILCTGYQRCFPFFEDGLIEVQKNGKYIPLYKNIFTSKFHKSLAFIGMYSILGPVVPVAEIQSRYAAEVFKNNVHLPSKKDMETSIAMDKINAEAVYGVELKEYNLIGNCFSYSNDLAYSIGCQPSIINLMFTDPYLAWHLIGKHSIYEYRLIGPNQWPGARDAIITNKVRMFSFMDDSRDLPKS